MTLEAKNDGEISSFSTNPIALVSDPLDFNRKILRARIKHFQESLLSQGPVVFFDRGIPDIMAYMDYFDQEYGAEFIKATEDHRYDAVYLLPMWKGIYITDGERFESYGEALQIHDHLREAYTNSGYDVIEVPKDSVPNRIRFILKSLNRI